MERLTEEEASYFLPLDEWYEKSGYKLKDCNYTITCVGDGWEEINYYTSIKRNTDSYEGKGPYYIYVLSNEGYGNEVYKVGFTKHHPEHRAKQLSRGTGVLYPFNVEYVFRCHDGEFLEREVHKALKKYRLNNDREFFKVKFSLIKDAIEELGEKFKGN